MSTTRRVQRRAQHELLLYRGLPAARPAYRKSHSAYRDLLKGTSGDETLLKFFRDEPRNRLCKVKIAGLGEFLAEMEKKIHRIRNDRARVSAASVDSVADMKGESIADRSVVSIFLRRNNRPVQDQADPIKDGIASFPVKRKEDQPAQIHPHPNFS